MFTTVVVHTGNVSQKEKDKRLKQPGYLHLLAREMFTSPPEQVIVTIAIVTIAINMICFCLFVHNSNIMTMLVIS